MSAPMKRMPRVVLVLGIALGLLAAMALPAAAGPATISVLPRHGPPTHQVSVLGAGFLAAETVDVAFDGTAVVTAAADEAGAFATSFAAPAGALPGHHEVTATGEASGREADARFLVRTNWRQFRGGTDHLGFNRYENVLTPSTVGGLVKKWSVTAPYTPAYETQSSPAVVAGRVYVGGTDGYVYAFNAVNGSLVWKIATDSGVQTSPVPAGGNFPAPNAIRGIHASPAVVGGVVYIPTGGPNGSLYALKASTGEVIWKLNFGNYIYASPTVSRGVVYVSDDQHLYAFDAASGTQLWMVPTGESYYPESSPAVAGGIVYVGSASPPPLEGLYAFRAATGELLWHVKNIGIIGSAPVVSDHVVYVGSQDHHVYAFHAATGKRIWATPTGDHVFGSPAVANGVVYEGSLDGFLYALDASSGTALWRSKVNTEILVRPDGGGWRGLRQQLLERGPHLRVRRGHRGAAVAGAHRRRDLVAHRGQRQGVHQLVQRPGCFVRFGGSRLSDPRSPSDMARHRSDSAARGRVDPALREQNRGGDHHASVESAFLRLSHSWLWAG